MSGAVVAAAAASGAAAGASGTPVGVAWGNIYAMAGGANAPVTLAGVAGAITVAAANSGASALGYTLGEVNAPYAGPFAWPEGQTLAWYLVGAGSGTVSVTHDGGEALASFTYTIRPLAFGGDE